MKRFALAVLALGVLALGFFLALLVLAPKEAGTDLSASPAAEPSVAEAIPEADLAPAPKAPRPASELAPVAEAAESVRAVITEAPAARTLVESAVATREITGRVKLPSGAPLDPTLEVLALERELDAEDLYGRDGALTELARREAGIEDKGGAMSFEPVDEDGPDDDPDEDAQEDEHEHAAEADLGLFARAPVGADGSFKLSFPAGASVGWVAVAGRYLYSGAPTRVDLTADTPVVVEARMGAWITGMVRLPLGTPEAELAGVRIDLEYDPTQFSFADLDEDSFFARRAYPDAKGRFELRAVDAKPPYKLEAQSDSAAKYFLRNLQLADGHDKHIDIALVQGGSVRGRVTDEAGAPVADARVEAGAGSFFGFAIDDAANAHTDADGWFELKHVTPGKVQLRAKREGFLDSKAHGLEIQDRESVDGVALELSAGAAVAGIVRLADGKPAEGIEVEVDFDPDAMQGMNAFNAARGADGEGKTDADGRFRIGGLGRGPFVVSAELKVDGKGFAARLTNVKPGSENLELTLAPDPVLSGTVVTPSGEPVTKFRITVDADDVAFFWVGGESKQHDVEDEGGAFSVEGLRAGKWRVTASAEGWAESEPTTVTLPPEPGAPALRIVLEPEALASGIVVDPSGNPIAGASVRRDLDVMESIASREKEVSEARTKEDGSFALGGLSEGTVSLVADHPEYVASEPVAVDLVAGKVSEGIELWLRVGGTVTGEVFNQEGKPAGGVTLFMQSPSDFVPVMERTEPDGTFRRENLKPGRWQISAMFAGFEEVSMLESEEPDVAGFLQGMRFAVADVKEGETTHVVIGAPPADPVKVTGTVKHAGGPLAKALVTLIPEGSGGLAAMKFVTTDDDGRFEALLDGPGAYMLQVSITQAGGIEQDALEFPQVIPKVEEHHVDVELPGGRISGRVIGPDGDPASGARVSLCVQGGVAYGTMLGGRLVETRSKEDGTFDILYLDEGTYNVAAGGALAGGMFGGGAVHGRLVHPDVRVDDGGWVRDLTLRLEPPGEISGQVLDVAGAPVAEASVFVRSASGEPLERFSFVATDASGRFRYTGIAPGRYTVSARTTELASAESSVVEVRADEVSDVTISVDAGTVLKISVVDEGDASVQARISVRDEENRQVNGILSVQEIMGSLEGLYSMDEHQVGPLPPGRYTVTATLDDGRTYTKPVTLSGQDERKLKIRLK